MYVKVGVFKSRRTTVEHDTQQTTCNTQQSNIIQIASERAETLRKGY
jgi:hypothetical protein